MITSKDLTEVERTLLNKNVACIMDKNKMSIDDLAREINTWLPQTAKETVHGENITGRR